MKITDEKIDALSAFVPTFSFEGAEKGQHTAGSREHTRAMCEKLKEVDTAKAWNPLIYMSESHTVLRK